MHENVSQCKAGFHTNTYTIHNHTHRHTLCQMARTLFIVKARTRGKMEAKAGGKVARWVGSLNAILCPLLLLQGCHAILATLLRVSSKSSLLSPSLSLSVCLSVCSSEPSFSDLRTQTMC